MHRRTHARTHARMHTHTIVLRLYGFCSGQPGWDSTWRNTQPLCTTNVQYYQVLLSGISVLIMKSLAEEVLPALMVIRTFLLYAVQFSVDHACMLTLSAIVDCRQVLRHCWIWLVSFWIMFPWHFCQSTLEGLYCGFPLYWDYLYVSICCDLSVCV